MVATQPIGVRGTLRRTRRTFPTGVLVVAAAAVGSRHYAAATSIRDNAPLSSATELARRTNEPTTA